MTCTSIRRLKQPARPGAVALGAIMVLVFLQLLIVGAVVTGTRDQSITQLRLDSVRTFYASEAGMNMAVREAMRGVDEDGDGTIASISNDNNPNNDPVMAGGARVSVACSTVSGTTTLVSSARSGSARRKVDGVFSGTIGGNPQTLIVAFGRASSVVPRYCSWNGSSWSASQVMSTTTSSNIKWVRMKLCPARNETMFIAESDDDHVNIQLFNGSSWSSTNLVSTDTGGTNDRPEDCAYEQVSNDGLSVYWKGTVSKFGYRIYNGTSFLSENLLSSPFSTECDWVTLAARPQCDEIMMLAVDGVSGGPLVSAYWNGSSFGSWTTVCSSLATNNAECFSMVFEAMSRRGLCVYSETGQSTPRYRTWNGSSWSSQASLPSIGAVAQWIRLAPDPSTNTVLAAFQDAANDLNVCTWNGTSWGSVMELETSLSATDRRQFDLVFERGTGRGLIVYAESGSNSPKYRTWNGSTWSVEASLPSIGASTAIVHLARGFSDSEVFAAISDTSRRLHVLRWNGTSWSSDTIVETNLSGPVKDQSFSLPEPTPAPHPRLTGWAEAAP